ncbi:MAG: DUF2270 domain-containing protein [Alphaproteobacteria bacterium]|nr:MAG: DUF2270 domain-containing protein [Alphaproteobacteria bacterium]
MSDLGLDHRTLNAAEIGAVAHLYRGEVYRSTIWRTRLDHTTNWAVVTLGVALSVSFAAPEASPLPLMVVGVLIVLFLMLEARRYRYFNVWRARARWLERNFYAPMLLDGDLHLDDGWQKVLAQDYLEPRYHVGMMTAIGRRIRRNYLWILIIQSLAFMGKIAVHPFPVMNLEQAFRRADVGPVPGQLIIVIWFVYVSSWIAIAIWSYREDRRRAATRGARPSHAMG